MDLNAVRVFTAVVEGESFSAAARRLGIPKSTVSRKVAALEEQLGVRLLQRTTRRLSLTDAGHAFYAHGARITAEAIQAQRAVSSMQQVPAGLLRVTAPLSFGFIAPAVAEYMARHPDVQVELICTDRLVDLVREEFDIGIRAGRLRDSSLVSRKLGTSRSVVVASPAYLVSHSEPRHATDLAAHSALLFGAGSEGSRWTLQAADEQCSVQMRERMIVNDFEILKHVAMEGLGVALMPRFSCAPELESGQLVRLLPAWASLDTPVRAIIPSGRHLATKVSGFLDLLKHSLRSKQW